MVTILFVAQQLEVIRVFDGRVSLGRAEILFKRAAILMVRGQISGIVSAL